MISIPTINLKGESEEKVKLPENIFGLSANNQLLAQSIRVFRNNQRAGSAKTKTRGEIKKTTAKMYRQKGTGKARHGSYSAPIFVGGGISHGPDGNQNFSRVMPKTMKKLALFTALSAKVHENLVVLSKAEKVKKSSELSKFIDKFNSEKGKLLAIVSLEENNLFLALRNLKNIKVIYSNQINPYLILSHKKVILTSNSLEEIKKRYAN